MQVEASNIDFTDIDKNEFRLKPDEGGNDFEGQFANLLNGIYEASLSLSSADQSVTNWEWRGRIEDDSGNEFEARVDIRIINGQPEELVITGTIDSISAGLFVVNGTPIFVNAQTIVFDEGNQSISFADLRVDDRVEVQAIRDENANLIAREVRREASSNVEVELRAEIESIGGDSLVVLGKIFFVDGNTEILDNDDNPIPFDQLVVGQTVEIRADVQTDGTRLATRIKIEDETDDEVELTGVIDAITDTSVTVYDIFFLVNDSTQILDDENNPISLDGLAVGLTVEIRGEKGADGVLRATLIEIEDESAEDDEVEVTGTVADIGEDFVVVAGFTFLIDDQTSILDNNNNVIALSDIKVGFIVEVRADVRSDASLLATEVKIENFFEDEVEITGPIESIEANLVVVSGLEFVVTDSTVILDNDNRTIELDGLEIGVPVEVRADVQFDGTFVATRIKIEDPFQDEVELTGTIDELGADSLVVSGITFFVDAATEILDDQNNPIVLADLTVGMLIEIRATRRPDGSLIATRIKIEDRIEDEVQLTGVIEQLSESTITVLGRTFGLTANTLILDENGVMVNLSNLFVGQTVEVRGDLLSDGTLVAIRVKIEDQNANEIEVIGPIESFGSGTIEVIGIHFFVNDTTVILDSNNNPINLEALSIGQTVELRAMGQPNGTRVATRIKIEDVLLLSGVIEQIDFNGISIVGQEVLFDANTLILGKLNKFITLNELKTGQFVQVRALMGVGNAIFGTKVRVQGDVITSIEPDLADNTRQPETFILLRNYPNPFNPATTILFRIPAGEGNTVQARLTIFNLLGQTVRNLFSESVEASVTHQRRWDGKDDNGRNLPSGIYLYRLEAGAFKKTQRMTLIK